MTSPMQPDVRGDQDSAEFWRGCQRRQLLGQKCGQCATWRWPPREYCPSCHAADPIWERLEGTGVIVGLVICHRPLDPAFAHRSPLPIVHVQLDGTDGEMVMSSNLLPGQWPQAAVGQRVDVRFILARPGLLLPHFTLDFPRVPLAEAA